MRTCVEWTRRDPEEQLEIDIMAGRPTFSSMKCRRPVTKSTDSNGNPSWVCKSGHVNNHAGHDLTPILVGLSVLIIGAFLHAMIF